MTILCVEKYYSPSENRVGTGQVSFLSPPPGGATVRYIKTLYIKASMGEKTESTASGNHQCSVLIM